MEANLRVSLLRSQYQEYGQIPLNTMPTMGRAMTNPHKVVNIFSQGKAVGEEAKFKNCLILSHDV